MTMDIITLVSIGMLYGTAYRPVPEQTDDTPTITANGEFVSSQGLAVSQDLMWSGQVCFGDWLYVDGIGYRKVNDLMNARHRKRFDVLVWTHNQEKHFKVGPRRVWLWKAPDRKCRMDSIMRYKGELL